MEPKALKAAMIAVCGSPHGGSRCTNAPSAGRCWGSKTRLLPWSFPVRGDVAVSLAGLLANNEGCNPKRNFSGTKRHFVCPAPLNEWLADPGGSVSPRDAVPPLSAAPRATTSKLKDTQARSLETCRFLIKGNKLKIFQ